MDWNDKFERLTAPQQLGIAAALAEHVVPLVGAVSALDDGLALVWLHIAGRETKKLELARALNAAIASARLDPEDRSARTYAARSVFNVLEAALHNQFAAVEAIRCALAAAEAFGETAAGEERRWVEWAVDIAPQHERPTRATFAGADAPTFTWRAALSSDDLPLFEGRR